MSYPINSYTTNQIIASALNVYQELGYGFREKIYSKSMIIELKERGLAVCAEKQIKIFYKEHFFESGYIDLIVENNIILELKSIKALDANATLQTRQYMRATGFDTALLFNFGPRKVEWKRIFIC